LKPYQQEIKKLGNHYLKQDYYSANSFGGTSQKFIDSITYLPEMVVFSGKDTSMGDVKAFSIAAKKGEVTVPLGDTIIRVNRLELLASIDGKYNNGDTVRKPPLVSIASYILKPKRNIDWIKLKGFGVFVEQVFKK
jgi:hypothetical protein